MRTYLYAVALCVPTIFAAEPSYACYRGTDLNLDDVRYADLVVVGRVSNYELVTTPRGHQYARFDLHVEDVLVGEADKAITVGWENSTFREPESMGEGPFLIALRDPIPVGPPLRGPIASLMLSPDRKLRTVLQRSCAPPFIFPSESSEAETVRATLKQ